MSLGFMSAWPWSRAFRHENHIPSGSMVCMVPKKSGVPLSMIPCGGISVSMEFESESKLVGFCSQMAQAGARHVFQNGSAAGRNGPARCHGIDLQWFAAEDEGRTEEASEYKLQKAREEGRVAKSQELNGTIVFLFGVVLLIALAPWMLVQFEEAFVFFFNASTSTTVFDVRFAAVFARYFVMLTLPFLLVGMVAGVVANIVQNRGFLFTTKTIEPKFDKILPHFGQYFKRTLFSFEGVFNVVKSIFKVTVIALVVFLMVRGDLPRILELLHTGGPELATRQIASMTAKLLVVTSVILLLVGIADYVVQRRTFRERMKMTKQEVKEEYKELEGDPEIKYRIENAQREMLTRNINRAVRESDVVITNPTHYAVALEWKQGEKDSPEVTAKGQDVTAETIKRIARENSVPIVENRPLARGLYTDTEVGDIIPLTYLRAIATVYVQIGYMDSRRKAKK